MLAKWRCKRLLKKQAERLKELKGILKIYTNLPKDPKILLERLVEFFDEISKFQDEGDFETGIELRMKEYIPQGYILLKRINADLKRFGREKYGWNRTEKGEKVTLDNVYLGNVYGINTFTVLKWINTPEDATHLDIIDEKTGKPIWLTRLIAERQVRPFMSSVQECIDDIEYLLRMIIG